MKFGITLGRLNPARFDEVAVEADRLGFESVWLPEHLVFPVDIRGRLTPGEEHPPVPPSTPVFDACAYLSYLAGLTTRIRLGTFVYLLGLRHPFVSARAFATLDHVSGGRAEAGIGAGWLVSEWEAAGLEPRDRGPRLDEAVEVCRKLWTQEVVEHRGEHFDFPEVMFEPKPPQGAGLPVLVGGESDRALRRAARLGDGWIGMEHTPDSAAQQVQRLRRHEADAGRTEHLTVTVMGVVNELSDVDRWERAGVDRLIVVPWHRSREAVDGLRRFADQFDLPPA